MSNSFSGLKIEYSVAQMCHECKLPIVNTGALSVSRYRGTIGAKPTLFYHKECLFKSTMHKIPDYKRGACNVCKGRITTPLNFTFESKRHKNAYHEDCVKKFIKEHEYEFDMRMRNANFAGVLANFDTELSFKKVTKLTEMDHLFTRLNTYDAVKKSLSTSRVARERYIYDGPSIGPRGVLREQYIRDNFGMILCKEAEGYIEGKSKSYKLYNNFRVRNLLAEEAVKQWTLLSVEVKNAAAVVLVERLDLDHLGRVWKELLLEAKQKVCQSAAIDFEFFEKYLRLESTELIDLLRTNYNLKDERVKLILNEEANILAKSW